jgi:apolipoprotein N-acyltransferase
MSIVGSKSKFFKLYGAGILSGILSGILVGTSYIPSLPWALIFAYVPLWIYIQKSELSWKQIFFAGWWTQFVLSLIGFPWIFTVSKEFGNLPTPVSILILLVFAAFVHLYIPVACLLSTWLKKKFRLSVLESLFLVALLQVLAEIYWPSMFAWNLGYPWLWIKSPIAQTADLWGFQGLSLLTHLINVVIAATALRIFTPTRATISICVTLVCLITLGKYRQTLWQNPDSTLNVLQVQANIGNLEKAYAEKGAGYQQFIADQYFSYTREGLSKYPQADLIVWPESAFPDYLSNHTRGNKYSMQFFNFVQTVKKPFLIGAYSKDPPGKNKADEYNSLFLFDLSAVNIGEYHKTDLLAYGEYTPFSDIFPFFATLSPAGTGFGRGSGPTVLSLNSIKFGTQICYESLSPSFSQRLAQQGANVLVNLTNDSWFGQNLEPQQHMIMTLARSVETRLPIVRSTNTGITTAMLADGTQLQQSPIGQPWYNLFEIKYFSHPEQTFYTRFGAWLGPLVLLALGLIVLGGYLRARSNAS